MTKDEANASPKDAALRLALEALSEAHYVVEHRQDVKKREQAITAIKEALAQPEQDWIERERAVGYREGHQNALKQMAQPEQEPLEYWNAVEGWVKIEEVREHFDSVGCGTIYKTAGEDRTPLYTTPPQRTWVGLTDEEIKRLGDLDLDSNYFGLWYDFARAIEAKLKEKNT
jgi:hypothetical protein